MKRQPDSRLWTFGLLLLSGVAAWGAASNATLRLQYAGTNGEGRQTFHMEWDAASNATYRVQSGNFGDTAGLNGQDMVWETLDLVTPTGTTGRWTFDEAHPTDSSRNSRFFRLELPGAEIFSVEPARFPFGGSVELFVIGQCFGTNTQLRVGPLTLTNRVVVNPNLLQCTFVPPAAGTYVFELVATDGTALSSFAVECFDPVSPPVSVLQEPPDEPWASPHYKEVTGLDAYIDCLEIQEGGVNSGAHKVKEKGNRTRCRANIDALARVTPSGEVEVDEVDMVIPGVGLDFVWGRKYRSRTGPNSAQGNRWDFSYNVSVAQVAGGMEVRDGMGRADVFHQDTNGFFGRDEHFSIGTLTGGVFRLTFADTGCWEFHPFDGMATAGRLARIVDRNGNTMRLEYDALGRLTHVIDTLDRTNTVAYSPANGKIASVTDFTGRRVTYAYYRGGEAGGNEGDLRSVTSPPVTGTPNGNDFPAGKTTTYTYTRGFQDPRQNSLLRSVTDPKGQVAHRYVYQHNQTDLEFLRCIGEQRGATNEVLLYAHVPQTPSPANRFATLKMIINDRVGNVSEHLFDARLRELQTREFTGRAVPGLRVSESTNRPASKLRVDDPDWFETRFEWNADSLCTRATLPRGNATEVIYQRAYNQNAARSNTARRQNGNVRVIRQRACCGGADTDGDGLGDTDEIVERFEYDPRFGSPQLAARGGWGFPRGPRQSTALDGNRITTAQPRIVENKKGLLVDFAITHTDPRGTVTAATYDTRGNLTHSETTERKSGSVILTDREYNSRGQLTATIHPADAEGRRRRDECFYYDSGPQAGYLDKHIQDCIAAGFHLTNRFEYDARGNVTRVVDPRGFDTLTTYNALNQPTTRQTPKRDFGDLVRTTTFFSYDANDNVVQVDVENRDHTGALDPDNPLWSSWADYDLLDRPTHLAHETAHIVQGPRGSTNRFLYDGNGNLEVEQSPEAVAGRDPNNLVQYLYDERDLLFRALPAPGTGLAAMDRVDYDENGNLKKVSKVDAISIKQSVHLHDGFDRHVLATDPMGNVTTFAYDRNGNLVYERLDGELTDLPDGTGNRRLSEARYEYDSLNRVTRFRPAFFDIFTELPISDGEAASTLAYAPNGQLASETDDNGHTTTCAYDSAWRLARVTDAKTNVTQFAHDACGNVTNTTSIERSDLGGPEQRFSVSSEYDGRGRLTSSTDNAGNTDQYFYDSRDNLVRHVDPRGTLTGWTYDGLSRVRIAVGDLDGDGILDLAADVGATSDYDDNSRLVATTDDNGNVTRHAYDAVDRLVATTNADFTVTRLVWSPRHNVELRVDANGTVVSNTFDLLDRCVRRDIAPGPGVAATTTLETFDFDGASRLVRASTSPGGVEHTFVWNSLSDLGGQSQTLGGVTLSATATHDGVGNRTSLRYPSGLAVGFTYDALDQIVSKTRCQGCNDPWRGDISAAYAYEGPGRLGRVARPNGINTRLNWNGLENPANQPGDFGWRQVARVNHARAGGGGSIDTRIAAYDRAQNKTLRAQTVAFSTGGPTQTNAFAYDKLHRLTRGRKSRGAVVEQDTQYVLDGNGNRQAVIADGLAQPYAMDPALPEPADFQVNQYSLSPFGAHSYDRNGNLVSTDAGAGPAIYYYDYADRLVAVDHTVGPALFRVAEYAYDALGARVSKTLFPPAPAAPVTTTYFRDADSDGDGILEERENGALRRTYAVPHVFEQKGRVMFTDTGETLYFHDDELGNVLALTDAGGNVVERYDYDDYGLPRFLDDKGDPLTDALGLPVTSSPAGNPFLFHGMEWDAETGLYHNAKLGGVFDKIKNNPLYKKLGPAARDGGGCYVDPRTGQGTSRAMNIDGGMPNRISMNVTARAFAGNNPWSGGGGGGGGAGGLRSHEDVYVWKICHCGKKTCKNGCAGRKKNLAGGGGSGGAVAAYFNPKELTVDKSVPWQAASSGKWKTFRGGGLILHETTGVTRMTGCADASKNIREIAIDELNIDIREMTTGLDVEYRLFGPGAAHWGSAMFRKILDRGEAGDNVGLTGIRGHRDVGGYRLYGPGAAHWGSARLIVPVAMDKGLRFESRAFHESAMASIRNIR